MRLFFVITGTSTGGAELMLLRLIKQIPRECVSRVVSMVPLGAVGLEMRNANIPVMSLEMSPSIPNPLSIFKLSRILRRENPDIVHTWMYHADLLGGIAARLAGIKNIAWCIRQSNFGSGSSLMTRLTARICARLSPYIPKKIVCCSIAARDYHIAIGYDASKFIIIPNGFDLERFHPSEAVRIQRRRELSISSSAPVIGLVARFHPQKSHATFIEAARIVGKKFPEAKYILAGEGCDSDNSALADMLKHSGIKTKFVLLGKVRTIEDLFPAMDVAVSSSSYGEAFPNVLAEAMACGVPCVATDVGDSRRIIGQCGVIVKPNDPDELASGIASILDKTDQERRDLGHSARLRIAERYALESIVERYVHLYDDLMAD